jgi:PAS domain S-box-containing protein
MSGAAPGKGTTKSTTPLVRQLALGVLALNLLIVGLVGLSSYKSREQCEEQARVTSQNLAQVLEQYVTGVFSRLDAGVLATAAEAERELARGGIDLPTLDGYIKRQQTELSDLESLVVADSAGHFLNGVGAAAGRTVSAADRDHFIRLRQEPLVRTTISQPMHSRISGKWVIAVARRINKPDGSFGGMVSASFPFDKFYRIFSTIDVGRHGSIALRDQQLKLAVRYPELPDFGNAVGGKATAELHGLVQKGSEAGTYRARSLMDQAERCYSFRKISGRPYYLIVGLATDDYLAAWRSNTLQVGILAMLFCLVTTLSAGLLSLEWRHRNAALQELIRQETKYQTIADYTYAWEFWLSPDETFIYSSPSCKRITGYDQAAFYADAALLKNIVHPEDQPCFCNHRHQVVSDTAPHNLVMRIRHADGSVRWMEHECLPVYDESGVFLGTRGSNRDVTRRKWMEEALKESEEQFHQLFVQNWDAVVLLHQENFEVLDANPAMLSLFGYPLEELRDFGPYALAAPEAIGQFQALLQDAVLHGESYLDRAIGICRSGAEIALSAKTKLIRLREENVLYCSFRDISDRMRLEKEKAEVQSKLIHANKMTSLGMLVSGIAHEINNPNQYISLNASILADVWQDAYEILARHHEEHGELSLKGMTLAQAKETVPRLLTGVTEGARRINLIVADLKDFSRDKSGQPQSNFDLNKVVQSAVQILTHHIHKHTYHFQLELAEDIPGVKGKSQQIEQVVINLIANGLQALADKSKAVRVATWHEPETDRVVLTVSDQGKGMTKEILQRITEPFFSTKLGEGGTGLGLSISATLLKEHGGTLEFVSEPDLGTTATIKLQAARENDQGPQGAVPLVESKP